MWNAYGWSADQLGAWTNADFVVVAQARAFETPVEMPSL
jgi:hypothetical protein